MRQQRSSRPRFEYGVIELIERNRSIVDTLFHEPALLKGFPAELVR